MELRKQGILYRKEEAHERKSQGDSCAAELESNWSKTAAGKRDQISSR